MSTLDEHLALLAPMGLSAPRVDRVRLCELVTLPSNAPRAEESIGLHVVQGGSSRIVDGRRGFELAAGDVWMVRGAHAQDATVTDAARSVEKTGALCLRARYRDGRFITPSPSTPTSFHLPAARASADPLVGPLVSLLRANADTSTIVTERIFDALFAALERHRLAHAAEPPPPIALTDARLARTIAQLHERHAERWTVASLAKHAGMSRAAFARRFGELTGLPPHAYLERLRMDVARTLLARTDEGIAQLAVRVGYRSEHAFSRAFKRLVGEPPALFRRAQRMATRAAA